MFLLSLGHVPLTDDNGCQQDSARMTELYRLYSADVPGVLDIKWCDGIYGQEESGLPLFAAADANGDLSLWSVNRTETTGEAECHLLEILSAEDGGSLALSLDWSTVLCRRYVTDVCRTSIHLGSNYLLCESELIFQYINFLLTILQRPDC